MHVQSINIHCAIKQTQNSTAHAEYSSEPARSCDGPNLQVITSLEPSERIYKLSITQNDHRKKCLRLLLQYNLFQISDVWRHCNVRHHPFAIPISRIRTPGVHQFTILHVIKLKCSKHLNYSLLSSLFNF